MLSRVVVVWGIVVSLAACGGGHSSGPAVPASAVAVTTEVPANSESSVVAPHSARNLSTVVVDESALLQFRELQRLSVGGDELIFYNGSWDVGSQFAAVRTAGGDARWLDLRTPAEVEAAQRPASGWGWVKLAVTPDDQVIVGVLDWMVEGSGHELYVVTSADGGRRWTQRAVLKKSHYLALLDKLELGANGAWELTVRLDDCADCGVPLGVTRFRSDDAGYSWTLMAPE